VKYIILILFPFLLFSQPNKDRQIAWFNQWLKDRDNSYIEEFPKIKYRISVINNGLYKKANNTITLYNKMDTTVLVHELTHCYQYQIAKDEYDFIDKVVMPCRESLRIPLKTYWVSPIEIHARIMELRFVNNLSPCDNIVSTDLLNIPDFLNLKQFFTPQEITELLNNLY